MRYPLAGSQQRRATKKYNVKAYALTKVEGQQYWGLLNLSKLNFYSSPCFLGHLKVFQRVMARLAVLQPLYSFKREVGPRSLIGRSGEPNMMVLLHSAFNGQSCLVDQTVQQFFTEKAHSTLGMRWSYDPEVEFQPILL